MSDENHQPEDDITQMMLLIGAALLASMVVGYLVSF